MVIDCVSLLSVSWPFVNTDPQVAQDNMSSLTPCVFRPWVSLGAFPTHTNTALVCCTFSRGCDEQTSRFPPFLSFSALLDGMMMVDFCWERNAPVSP